MSVVRTGKTVDGLEASTQYSRNVHRAVKLKILEAGTDLRELYESTTMKKTVVEAFRWLLDAEGGTAPKRVPATVKEEAGSYLPDISAFEKMEPYVPDPVEAFKDF